MILVMVGRDSLGERLAALPDKPAKKRCDTVNCKRPGWWRCRGTCGRAWCGHHGPRRIDWQVDHPDRGTALCQPLRRGAEEEVGQKILGQLVYKPGQA